MTTASNSSTTSDGGTTSNSDALGSAIAGADTKSGADAKAGTETSKPATEGATTQADGKASETKPADPKAAPIELKLPDGFKADEKALAGFKALAAELGLDSAKAQKLFDLNVSTGAEAAKAATAAAKAEYAKQVEKWKAEYQADPDIGGEKWATSQKELIRAVQIPAVRELASVFRELGHGDHPKVVKALVHLGRAHKDDSVAGTAAATAKQPTQKSDAQIF